MLQSQLSRCPVTSKAVHTSSMRCLKDKNMLCRLRVEKICQPQISQQFTLPIISLSWQVHCCQASTPLLQDNQSCASRTYSLKWLAFRRQQQGKLLDHNFSFGRSSDSPREGLIRRSLQDIFSLFHLNRPFKFISKTSIFFIPIVGWSMFLTG